MLAGWTAHATLGSPGSSLFWSIGSLGTSSGLKNEGVPREESDEEASSSKEEEEVCLHQEASNDIISSSAKKKIPREGPDGEGAKEKE